MNPLRFKAGRDVIVGIGSALIDILTHIDDDFLEKCGAAKGGMNLVDGSFIEKTKSLITAPMVMVPGGSACNTIIGVGRLGGRARFVGKCGQDEMGTFFEADLIKNHVMPCLLKSTTPTGRVLSLITPDAQRSMFTYLGAASELEPSDLSQCEFEDAAVVHVEGYLLFKRELIFSALERAKQAGAMISLDLASFTVVEGSKAILTELVENFVDILLANEEEARAFTGQANELDALEGLSKSADIAALKVGQAGSYLAHQNRIIRVAPMGNGSAVDTTGAGDLWAAGFLYGLVRGYPLDLCGALGSACGYEVCQTVGANISEEGWSRIKSLMQDREE